MRGIVLLLGAFSAFAGILAARSSFASDLSEVLFTKGVMYYDQGRYQEAAQNLREAAREDPSNLEIRKYLHQAEAKAAGKPSGTAVYEDAVKKEPGAARNHLNLAVALAMEGQYDRAVAAIEEANRLSPRNGEILFYRGLIRFKKEAFREAVADFKEARNLEPRLAQGAMFYEAAALSKLGESQAAGVLFQRVVETNPMTDWATQATELSRAAEVKKFSLKLTTGVEYDTNVTLEGNKNILGVPLDLPDKGQFRFPLSALVDYRFLDLGEWSFGGRYGFYGSFHDRSSDMNVISNLAELYGVWRRPNWYIRPFYYFQSVFLDADHMSDTHTLGGNIMYLAPYNLAPEFYFRWQHKEYHFPTIDANDADGMNLRGEYNQYYLLQGGRGYLRAGIGMEADRTHGENLDYTAFLVLAGLQYQLPWELTFNFDFEYQNRSYMHSNTIFGVERDDLRYSFAWQLARPLGNGFDLKGRIAHIRNDSNIGDYDYDRQIYSLLLSWSY